MSKTTWVHWPFILGILCLFLPPDSFALGKNKYPDLDVVPSLDLNRYAGKWHEIARLPQRFEKNCVGVTAEYQVRKDGKVDVKNTCLRTTCEGKVSVANGLARVVDPLTNAKLKVSFFWPFAGDYWVLELDPNYSYAVVGSPDRKSFWILSRTPTFSDSLKKEILERFQTKGFSLENLETPMQCM